MVAMQLGEDWRMEANLFTEEIVDIKTHLNMQGDIENYSLFNEFMSSFLQGRTGREYSFSEMSETEVQEKFLEKVNETFTEEGSLQFM